MESRSGVGVVFALIAGFVMANIGRPERAMAQQAGGEQMFAVVAPGVGGAGSNVLFVIDPSSARIMVYEHRGGQRLELVSVRNMEYEVQFQQWPENGPRATQPSVSDMRELVQKAAAPGG
jgi:hypothetical protein